MFKIYLSLIILLILFCYILIISSKENFEFKIGELVLEDDEKCIQDESDFDVFSPETTNPATTIVQLETTQVPTTQLETTQVPTTQLETTRVPTTQRETTRVPTTQLETTRVPTTIPLIEFEGSIGFFQKSETHIVPSTENVMVDINNEDVSGSLSLDDINIITGELLYLQNNATSITGPNNLHEIKIPDVENDVSGLFIDSNDNLTKISGFENLVSIEGAIEIANNFSLTEISGFNNLVSVEGLLAIIINPFLRSAPIFSKLTRVGSLRLFDQQLEWDLNTHFPALTSIGNANILDSSDLSDNFKDQIEAKIDNGLLTIG